MPLHRICRQVRAAAVFALTWALGVSALADCSKRAAPHEHVAREVFARGDHVLAERAGAEFFEGRVLAADGERLRVQAVGGNDSLNVLASDVYRLPPAAYDFTPNQLAICGREADWVPCRVTSVTGAVVHATNAQGTIFEVGRERVLAPSALTELNLKRYFSRNEAELAFKRSATLAGEPRPEPNWHPTLHERLLVRRSAEWFTGYVHELVDDGAEVSLSASPRNIVVPFAELAAEPPSSFVNALRHGDFVLVRPDAPSDPWPRWQVRAVDGSEIKLVDAAGRKRSASAREVVPLSP